MYSLPAGRQVEFFRKGEIHGVLVEKSFKKILRKARSEFGRMPKTKLQKEQDLQKIKEQIQDAKSIVFTDYKGMTVKDIEEIRKEIRNKGGKFEVAKITLVKKAFDNKEITDAINKASLALAYAKEDEVSVPKEIKKFAKTNPNIQIIGGFYEGGFISKEKIEALADIPSKEELIIKLMNIVKSPMYGVVRNIGDQIPKLVRTLQAIVDKG